MKRNHKKLATALALWVTALPSTGAMAQRRPVDPPPPMFHREGRDFGITNGSGLEVSSAVGHWHHQGKLARGGDATAVSPWGETLKTRYVVDESGFEAVLNERISIATSLDDYGNPAELIVRANGKESVVDLAAQAHRMATGRFSLEAPDLEAYALLIEALMQEQSLAFWRSLADEFDAVAPAGCGLPILGCSLSIIGWLGSLSGLITICGGAVASAGALTPGCIAAVLVHPTVSTATALSCANAIDCIETEWGDSQGDEGCTSPGGQE